MGNRIIFSLAAVALAVLCNARGVSTHSAKASCDVEAYVVDADPKGLNVRDAPGAGGKVVGVIPKDGDGTIVHLTASSPNGWVQIDRAENIEGTAVFNGKGWVSGNMLATETRGYGTRGVRLRGEGRPVKVVGTIPPETEVRVAGCAGERIKVKYKSLVGLLEREDQCPNPVTLCN